MTSQLNFDYIRATARGQWPGIIGEIVGAEYVTGKNTPCPACGGHDCYQFNRRSEVGAFSCRKHDHGGGDGFELIMHALDCDFVTAARRVAEVLGLQNHSADYPPISRPVTPQAAPAAVDYTAQVKQAAGLWKEARPITAGDAAGAYLLSRKLRIPATGEALRFHPAVEYWDSTGDKPELIGRFPALLARIAQPGGAGAGLHRIYLNDDGSKFSHGNLPAKKLLKAAELSGCAVRLTAPQDDRLGIAEGIETAMAFQQMTFVPTWSALSSSLMPSVIIPDGVKRVYIAVDPDEAGERAAQRLADRLVAHGVAVWINRPPVPGDWNDALMEVAR